MKKTVLFFTSFLVLFSVHAYADHYVDQISYSQSNYVTYSIKGNIAEYYKNGTAFSVCPMDITLRNDGTPVTINCKPMNTDGGIVTHSAECRILRDVAGNLIFVRTVSVFHDGEPFLKQIKKSPPLKSLYKIAPGMAYWKAGEIEQGTATAILGN